MTEPPAVAIEKVWKLGRTEEAIKIVTGLLGRLDPPPDAVLPFADDGVTIRWSPGIVDDTAHVSVYVFGDGVTCIGWMMTDGCRNDDWTLPEGVSAAAVNVVVKRLIDVVRSIDAVDIATDIATDRTAGPPDLTAEELEYGAELASTLTDGSVGQICAHGRYGLCPHCPVGSTCSDEVALALAQRLDAWCIHCEGTGEIGDDECNDCDGHGQPSGLPPLTLDEASVLHAWVAAQVAARAMDELIEDSG